MERILYRGDDAYLKGEFILNVQSLLEYANSVENRGLISAVERNGNIEFANQYLITARLQKGYTQENLAQVLHIDPETLRKIEKLRLFPNTITRPKIATFLDVDSDLVFPEWLQEFIPPEEEQERIVFRDELAFPRQSLLSAQEVVSSFGKPFVDPQEYAERRDVRDIIFGDNFLTIQQKRVLLRTFGFLGQFDSYTELGNELGLTPRGVSSRQEYAIKRLRHPHMRNKIGEYLPTAENKPIPKERVSTKEISSPTPSRATESPKEFILKEQEAVEIPVSPPGEPYPAESSPAGPVISEKEEEVIYEKKRKLINFYEKAKERIKKFFQ
ncbi:MAG TPA: helix-turn-helix domain-containing protein [Candidatus Saccharimonadales bacterium]|nr:helix-turn-helix domain-containing protein [Candidatus Saccharimonadales bacterium]